MDAFVLLLVSIIFLAQLVLEKTRFVSQRVGFFGFLLFLIAVVAVFGFAKYQSWQQYLLWKDNGLSKLFLPPYQDWDYFVFYVRTRFFNVYLFSLAAGLVMMEAARWLNRKYENRFFEGLEPYLIGIGTFLVGYPLCFLYVPFVLASGAVVSSLFSLTAMPSGWRLSLRYLWLPMALLTIIVGKWLMLLPWWQDLQI
jgi:hypothetical protein